MEPVTLPPGWIALTAIDGTTIDFDACELVGTMNAASPGESEIAAVLLPNDQWSVRESRAEVLRLIAKARAAVRAASAPVWVVPPDPGNDLRAEVKRLKEERDDLLRRLHVLGDRFGRDRARLDAANDRLRLAARELRAAMTHTRLTVDAARAQRIVAAIDAVDLALAGKAEPEPLSAGDVRREGFQVRDRSDGPDAPWRDGPPELVGQVITEVDAGLGEFRAPKQPRPEVPAFDWQAEAERLRVRLSRLAAATRELDRAASAGIAAGSADHDRLIAAREAVASALSGPYTRPQPEMYWGIEAGRLRFENERLRKAGMVLVQAAQAALKRSEGSVKPLYRAAEAFQALAGSDKQAVSNGTDGVPGLRDPDNPCTRYLPGRSDGDCETDGHHLCGGCQERNPSGSDKP